MVFSSAILIVIWTLLVSPTLYTNYGLIKEFPDSEQKFIEEGSYKVTDRKLTNNERDKVIFPNDELTYSFKVHNLKNFATTLAYQIEFFNGGVREEPIYSNYGRLDPLEEENQVTRKIYLKSSGSYDVKLNLFFSNSTDEKYAQYSPPMDSIETLSRSEQSLITQNENISNGVTVSLIIGSLTVIALVGSLLYSRREVKQLESNNEFESRPWLSVTRWDRTNSGAWELTYKNFGKIPPKAITLISISQYDEITREKLEKEKINPNDVIGVLFPNSQKVFRFNDLHNKITDDVKSKKKVLWIGVRIDYEFKSKHGKYAVICTYSPEYDNFTIENEWTDIG
jgi:hypothetical protein